jgi:hypothetical protein
MAWASAAVAQSGRVGSWGGQVFGKIASKMMVMIMLFSKVLRGGGWILTRRASTQAELSPGQRGMETTKFGRDLVLTIMLITLTLIPNYGTRPSKTNECD